MDETNLQDAVIRVNYVHDWAPFNYQTLANLKRIFFRYIPNNELSRFDLKGTSKTLSDEMVRLYSDIHTRQKYENILTKQKEEIPQNDTPKKSEQAADTPVIQKKPKETDEMKRDRWETQLLQRMEKHSLLVARKEKILKSKMKDENKEKRLTSINRQLLQNEKAQYILNRKLSVLDATQNLNGWKQTTKEERSNYTELNRDLKGLTQTIRQLTKEHRPKHILKSQREDLTALRQLKTETLLDYRTAQKATKAAIKSLMFNFFIKPLA